MKTPLRILSVSLGSSKRDKTAASELMGVPLSLERMGVDGKFYRAVELITQLAPEVQAVGLGGIDLYLYAGDQRYTVRDALKLAQAAGDTPVADGSRLKRLLEPALVYRLMAEHPEIPLKGRKVLMVSGVDRTGMAKALAENAGEIVFGDFIFALGLPIPLRSYRSVVRAGRALLPIITKLPFQFIYPTGEKQDKASPKQRRWLEWAEVIAGDFHYIRRNLPASLEGKVVLTNTTTEEDREVLAARGLRYLVTTTPMVEGRSFGMNVLEGSLLALMNHFGDPATDANMKVYLNKLDLHATVTELGDSGESVSKPLTSVGC